MSFKTALCCIPFQVQKTSIMGMTTNIKRECADECYYGCRAKNFGITTMYCTTCCRTSGCNVDGGAAPGGGAAAVVGLLAGTCIAILFFR